MKAKLYTIEYQSKSSPEWEDYYLTPYGDKEAAIKKLLQLRSIKGHVFNFRLVEWKGEVVG